MSLPHRPPLADRMRPIRLEQMVGQEKVLGPDGTLPRLLRQGRPPSLILWGPPGCGKTTVARIIAETIGLHPVAISAVTSGVKDIKEIVAAGRASLAADGPPTLLFVDEIHRFNKSQQDVFLGPVEDGTLILVGATTENPSFQLNAALLSRCRVLVLEGLDAAALAKLLDRALTDSELGLGEQQLSLTTEVREHLIASADGDGRALLTDLEWISIGCGPETGIEVDLELAQRLLARRLTRHDRAGDKHYNIASAFQKSIRGSDPQAGLYWLARMLEGGEDPLFVARRLVVIASEDVGLADPQALPLAVAARDSVHFLGMPEGALALAELVVYLATAPKSNAVYRAWGAAVEEVRRSGTLPVPMDVRNAPTRLMKELGYGAGYRYPPDDPLGLLCQFVPDEIKGKRFYKPGSVGFEREVSKRIEYYQRLRREASQDRKAP